MNIERWLARTIVTGLAAFFAVAVSFALFSTLFAHPRPRSFPRTGPAQTEWQIAFERNMIFPRFVFDGRTPSNIFVVGATASKSELQLATDGRSFSPIWLPDQQHILFVRSSEENPAKKRYETIAEIMIMDRDGGNPRTVTSLTTSVFASMALSPDGRTLAFEAALARDPSRPFNNAIYLLDLDAGGEPRHLVDFGSLPSWSPDSSQIVYACKGRLEYRIVNTSACVLPAAGNSEPRLLAENAETPKWSPAGENIIYVSRATRKSRLVLAKADGSKFRDITNGEREVRDPVWSPDGKRIAFTELRPMDDEAQQAGALTSREVPEVFVTDLDGRAIGPLGHKKQLWCHSLAWSPDGSSIAAICASGLRDAKTRKELGAATLNLIDARDPKAPPLPLTGNASYELLFLEHPLRNEMSARLVFPRGTGPSS